MVKFEIIDNSERPHNNITCLSCMSNNDDKSYVTTICNTVGEYKFLLCKKCFEQLKTELEFLEIKGE